MCAHIFASNSILYGDRQLYVLSLPSFSWFQVHISDSPRVGHTCVTTATNQMIIIGGTNDHLEDATPDPWDQGIGVFDLTTMQFNDAYYSDAAPYAPSYDILKHINNVR